MRCLSIARALKDLQAEVTFIVSDDESASMLNMRMGEKEFAYEILNRDYRDMKGEIDSLRKIIPANSVLLVDSYSADETYFLLLRSIPGLLTAYIDDFAAASYDVDVIINYNDIPEPECYKNIAKKLLGTSYIPLRNIFSQTSFEVRDKIQNIMISTGGGDLEHSALFFSENLPSVYPSINFNVLTGAANPDLERLEKLEAASANLILHPYIEDMAGFLCNMDLAVSAGGGTLNELCAVGVPAISYSIAQNQIVGVKAFADNGVIPYAGDIRGEGRYTVLDNVTNYIDSMADKSKRASGSKTMKAHVDGLGAERIAEALLSVL